MKNAAWTSLTHARLKNFLVAMLTLGSACLLPSAQGAVTVDQVPLTVQSPIAPNILMLLDDSGSMAWNFMPDLCASSGTTTYVSGVTCSGGNINSQSNNDALTNSNNNGVYYNPAVTYTQPIKVDGTSYPNSPGLTTAYADGFTNTATSVNITTYANTSTFSVSVGGQNNYTYTGGTYETEYNNTNSGQSNVAFSTSTAAISATCSSGYSMVNLGTYASPNYQCGLYGTATPTCSSGTFDATTGTCVVIPPTPTCGTGFTLTGSGSSTTCSGTAFINPTCPSSGTYGTSTGLCTLTPTSCATTYGSGFALTNTGTTAAPNYQCQKTAAPTCSSGTYSSTTGTCAVTPPAPTCGSGFSLADVGISSPNYQCRKLVTPTCSSGSFSASTGTCTVTPPVPTCSVSGTSLSKPTGASAYNCNSTPTCSSGTYTASSGTCAVTPPAPTCPSGTSLSKPTGASTYNCNSTPTCSSGTYTASSGTCTVTPPVPTCSTSGTSLSKPTGATAYNCNSTPTCTSGGTYNNTTDTCTTGTRTCPSGTTRGKFSGASIYTCNATAAPSCSSGTFTASSGTCAVTPPTPTCPSGTSLGQFTGATVFTCNATPACSSGTFTASSGTCAVTPPAPTCPSGTSLGQFSGATVFTCNATPSCSSGTFTASSGTCAVTPPAPTCSSGTLTNIGTVSSPNYQCQATATPTCSTGTYSSSTGACTVTPPAPTCASGLTLTNTGTSTSPNYQCQKTATPACSPTTYSYASSGGMCTFVPISCPAGYAGSGSGTSLVCSKPVTATPTCSSGTYSASTGACVVTPPTPTCSTSGYSLTNTGTSAAPAYQCAGYTTVTATCSSGTFSSTTGQCTVTGTATRNFFQYSTGPAAGPYVTAYVASAAQGCVNIPHSSSNCVDENDTSGVAAPAGVKAGQNIANWFSYYRTRILTAKSGLTAAFDKLDPSTRLGFASINGNKNTLLPGTLYSSGGVSVAPVNAFDNSCVTSTTSPCTKGQTGTQRNSFWNWVTKETVGNSTALRTALNTLGLYYTQDGPWQNSVTDTTKLACRQSYAIATTDGFWNDPTPPSPGNVDNTTGSTITGPNGQSYTYKPVAPFSDATSNTLADVAMKYWSTDLQPSVPNEVPTGSADPAFWQHMTTFTLGLGFTPQNITPAGTTIDQIFVWSNGADSSTGTAVNGNIPSNFAWPVPASNSINNIADLAHAGVNGHGGFYSATSPQAFSAGIADAISRVQTRVGTGASLAANSTKLGVGTVTYQALYYTGKWSGDLKAYNVDPTTGAIAAAATWSASLALPAAASRNIMTYNPSGTTSSTKFVAFSSPSSLSSTEQSALGSTTAVQQNMINYLRGDSSLEINHAGGIYRQRSTPLGDIINSQPVYVGTPNPNLFYGKTFTGSNSYAAFAATNVSRAPVIWVAANDGMLHAFQTSNGAEVFAYLPASVITSSLSNLANINYGGASVPHQLYNDGEITVADVYTTLPSGTTAAWRTVLVGTTGRGLAKAVYALDITDPTSPIFLWERSAADGLTNSGYIGQITGQPVITQNADGTWSVLTGNGYNSTQNKAALLQFDLMAGTLTVHATDNTTDNGLAAPVVWINTLSNNIGTTAYAGDLKGRVWSFVIYDDSTTALGSTPSSAGSLLFTTSDGSKAQPITAGMLAGKDPKTGNLWLFFGTGQYFTSTDLSNRDVQTWYGIIVRSSSTILVTNLASWTGSRTASSANALVPRSITAQQDATSTTLAARTITVSTDGDMIGKSGWFIDLLKPPSTAQGERMVTPNQFQGSLLLGTSRVPVVSDPCNPSGSGWIMAINPFTGGNPSAVFFDLNGDQKFDANDMLNGIPVAGIGFGSVANNPIFVGNTMLTSFDNGTISSIDTAGTIGAVARLSWRELVTH